MIQNSKGFGLILLIFLIAVFGILFAGTSVILTNASRRLQLEIDKTKAHYLAQAGVMRGIYDWKIDAAGEAARQFDDLNTTITGNQIFKTGCQADFAYFSFNLTQDTEWFTSGGRQRLRRWRLRNVHVAEAGTADNIIVTSVKISWTPAGSTVRQVQLGGSVVLAVGSYANGSTNVLTGTAGARTTTPGSLNGGNGTFIEWNTAPDPPDPITVNVQWTFSDNSSTKDSISRNILYWDGARAGTPPTNHTFMVTSTGQVNQSGGQAFKVLETVRATVSGAPGGATAMEITDWQTLEKHIP